MEAERLKRILEAVLLAAGRPLSVADLERMLAAESEPPPRDAIRRALADLGEEWSARSLVLQEVASGFRAQVRDEFEPWVARLWEEKPPRYSRALLETLAIIAYRQPVTRSEIEDIRGVSVSTQIMRTLSERDWIRVVGHRDTPGRPAMYATTRQFLDHFNLKTLDQLPPISELRAIEGQHPELSLEGEHEAQDEAGGEGGTTPSATGEGTVTDGHSPGPEEGGAGAPEQGADDSDATGPRDSDPEDSSCIRAS